MHKRVKIESYGIPVLKLQLGLMVNMLETMDLIPWGLQKIQNDMLILEKQNFITEGGP